LNGLCLDSFSLLPVGGKPCKNKGATDKIPETAAA
jgi:hypothetical protein